MVEHVEGVARSRAVVECGRCSRNAPLTAAYERTVGGGDMWVATPRVGPSEVFIRRPGERVIARGEVVAGEWSPTEPGMLCDFGVEVEVGSRQSASGTVPSKSVM